MLNHRGTTKTEFHGGLMCAQCGRSLLAVPQGDTVAFYCKNGHQLPLTELLDASSEKVRSGLEKLLRDWETHLEQMTTTASEAQLKGYVGVAEIFYRQMNHLSARIQLLRDSVASRKPESNPCMPAVPPRD